MFIPRVGGGATHGEIYSASFPLGWDFDMAAILEDRENLEMSHSAKDLHCFFPLSVELISPWANER